MDFSTLKQKFSETTENLTQKAKEIGNKTLDFVGDNLANTPVFIQTEDEMNKELEKKRAIFIAFDEDSDLKKQITLLFPVWRTKAFIDGASFSFLNREKSEMLIQTQKFSLPLEMRIYFHGVETLRFSTIEEIKKWWENEDRDYEGKNVSSTNISTTSTEENASESENNSNIDTTSTSVVDPLVEQK